MVFSYASPSRLRQYAMHNYDKQEGWSVCACACACVCVHAHAWTQM